jgi:hypothetical protein
MTTHRLQRLLATIPPLLLLGALASADAITGRVVNASGVGVAGVDIDFIRIGGGGNPHEMNDGTDANGNFVTTVDPDVYEIRFYPPSPPTTTLLTGIVTPVVVSGTVNMGTITLQAGVSLQGTVKNQAGTPVSGVRVNAFFDDTGVQIHLKNNITNAFGTFMIAVPLGLLRGEYLTSGVVGQVLAPKATVGAITGPTNVGTVTLLNGYHVTGTVRRQNGVAVESADVDVTDRATGLTVFTPSDNTNTLGVFDVVLPAGNFDLDVTRPAGLVLVSVEVKNFNVPAATNLGVLTMRNGVFLSGTVVDSDLAPVQGVDVNVKELATGLDVALGSDNTAANGTYQVVVPTGLLQVVFSPPGPHEATEKDWHRRVLVSADTVLNGQLPGGAPGKLAPSPLGNLPKRSTTWGMPLLVGGGIPGRGGATPQLGLQVDGTSTSLRIVGAPPGASARLVLGWEARDTARFGVRVVGARSSALVKLDTDGTATVDLPAASRGLHAQLLVPGAGEGGPAVSPVLVWTAPE